MLWLLFGALVLLVVGTLAYPLLKRGKAALPERVDFDVVVYRDQLKELEEEIDRGVINEDQGAAARTEIQRRMLAAEDADLRPASATPGKRSDRAAMVVALALIVLVPSAGAVAMYGALGSPELAKEQSRGSSTSADALEAQLKASPSAEGYKRLANLYFAESRFDKAVAADHRAIDLGASDSVTWSEFGESIVMAGDGQVPSTALVAFTNAISLDPADARARFYIGLAEAQIGKLQQAVAIWRDLQKGADPNSKWYPMVQQHIDAFSREGGFDPASISPAAPSAEALRSSVAAMRAAVDDKSGAPAEAAPPANIIASSASSQDTMIRGMVERLAEKMRSSPNDATGWVRLSHAYSVLGEPEKARDAIAHAVRLKPDDRDVQLTLAETEKALRLSRNR